jgi:mannose-6-phosphate isomerase
LNSCPFRFAPIYKERIWAGRKLAEIFGRELPAGVNIGESWELADLENDRSIISNGPLAGQTLRSAIERHTEEITGRKDFTPPFPLLLKFLDAGRTLSVQVHPDEKACLKMGCGEPKTECWFVLQADPQSRIYKGLKRGTTRGSFEKAVNEGTVEELLDSVEASAGQCHYLPAGTVHALGAGILVAEIQLPSDTTYRVFDWNRLDDSGNPRRLHIAEALECIHFDTAAADLPVSNSGRLLDCPYFTIDKLAFAAGEAVDLDHGLMQAVMVTAGSGELKGRGNASTPFRAGQTLLVPAAWDGQILSQRAGECLCIRPQAISRSRSAASSGRP